MEIKNKIGGKLKISEDVVKKITGLAVLETKGVADCKENQVKVRNLGGIVEITVKIILRQGVNASSVATNVQNTVKDSVQTMTGIPVSKVNVIIDSINFES